MSWALARINWMKYLSVGWSHSPCSHNANTRQTIQIWERENLSYCTGLQAIEASHLSSGQLVIKITPSRHYHSNHLFLIRAVIVVLLSLSTARLEDEICLSYSESCCCSSLLATDRSWWPAVTLTPTTHFEVWLSESVNGILFDVWECREFYKISCIVVITCQNVDIFIQLIYLVQLQWSNFRSTGMGWE